MIKAPEITSLRVVMLGANFVYFKWDDVGSNFFYIVEYSIDNDDNIYQWQQRDVVSINEWFDDSVTPNTKYIFRFATTYKDFIQSDWVYSESIETFATNAYNISTMTQMIPNRIFVKEKLIDNKNYINFNTDPIYATLMNENFVYDSGIANITNIENFIAFDEEYHEILSPIEQVCVDVNRTYLAYKDDVLYTFERFQNMAKVSNDGGQNWWYYQALTGRIGYPISRTVMYQNYNTSFLLGYDDVFYGRQSDEIRFSSNQHFWSDDQITFVRMDVDQSIPFNTMVFGRYTSYPSNIIRKVEAQAASDTWIYAVANDNFRRILVKNAPVGDDGSGNTIRLWDETTYNITGNPLSVVKKLEVLDQVCYALVTGIVDNINIDKRIINNVKPSNDIGIYKFNEFYVPEEFYLGNINTDGYVKGINIAERTMTFAGGSHGGKVSSSWENRVFRSTSGIQFTIIQTFGNQNKDSFEFDADLTTDDIDDPVKIAAFLSEFESPNIFELIIDNGQPVSPVVPNGGEWVRIFGNTALERDYIEHEYTNMSTDGESLFINTANYKFENTIEDLNTIEKYENVDSAVKYQSDYPYLSDKRIHMYLWKTTDGINFERRPQTYYNEANFNWMYTTKQRCWISHDNKAVVVNPLKLHTYRIDPEYKTNKEIWNNGNVNFYLDNIKFSGFTQYCNGIMIHKGYDRDRNTGGEIIGYYEYPYRVRDNAVITWKPEYVAINAKLINQEKPYVEPPLASTGLIDPDLSPFIRIMGPESYFNDSNYTKFGEYYLKFISEGTETYYNRLLNLIKNKYPREKDSFEYLWSEIRKRNIYLDQEKRESVVRFFEANASNFYSSKGTAESYKFLFKLLYNADVEIEVESSVGIDYDIIVKSTNIDSDLVGRTIYTKTGRANVTYIDRVYENGLLRWKLTIHNLIGKFIEGQEIKSENTAFVGEIMRGVTGKELAYSDIDYINRNRSYYVMKIRSELNTARYKDDVLRFVHPVGFGFIGIAILTVFINGGISMAHNETMVEINKAYRWDAGLPNLTMRLITNIDPDSPAINPEPLFDPITGDLVETITSVTQFDIEQWENVDINNRNYDSDESDITWNGITYKPSERRLEYSPLFDAFSTRFSDLRRLTELRLKDDLNKPRDVSNLVIPLDPSQHKIGE